MNISIIIPNYNGEELLKRNLPKVINSVSNYKGNAEIIISDDHSLDNSSEYIKNEISNMKNTYKKLKINMRLLESDKNLGFSSNVNRGVKEAKGEIIILLNTDVIPEKNFLDPLLKHFQDSKVFAVGCMDKSMENNKAILRGRGLGVWRKGFLLHFRGEVDKTNTLWVSGGSGAFRKSIWEKLGGLDELYNPFYWEDIDLSYRALKSGYKILFEPKSIVTHEHEKGAIKSTYNSFEVKKIAYRNQFIFVWKNITDFSLILNHFFWLIYHLPSAIFRKDLAFYNGLLRAIIVMSMVNSSRQRQKKLFIKTDQEVLKQFQHD